MKKIIPLTPFILLFIVLIGCKPKTSSEKEINKLLDRQVQLQESQEEYLDDIQQLRDSLEHERNSLLSQRSMKDNRIKKLVQNQQILADKLKREQQSTLSTETARLQEKITLYEDSIGQLKRELARLDSDLDSIETSMDLYQLQEKQADKTLESGISELDQQMTRLEKQKQQEIKKANLLKRRIQIADKKLEAYTLERQMYIDRRDEMLRQQANEEQMIPFRNRIAEMDSIISLQQAHKRDIKHELDQTGQWISGVDSMMNDMQAKIKQEYDNNHIIETFIAAEKQRLGKELAGLTKTHERLISEQNMISKDLASTEEKIASLNKRLELIKTRKMSDILEQQAAIEQSDANLADEEIQLLKEATGTNRQSIEQTSDTSFKDFRSLQGLDEKLDSLNNLVNSEKVATINARKELSEKRAETARQRARFGRTLGTLATAIIIGSIILIALFYYMGKRARQS